MFCVKFSTTPHTTVKYVHWPHISKSTGPYSLVPSFSKIISTPRPGSIKWQTNAVSITTFVLRINLNNTSSCLSIEGLISLQKFYWFFSQSSTIMVGEKFQIYDFQITEKCNTKSKKMMQIILLRLPRQNSPPGTYHNHLDTAHYSSIPDRILLKIFPLGKKRRGNRDTDINMDYLINFKV